MTSRIIVTLCILAAGTGCATKVRDARPENIQAAKKAVAEMEEAAKGVVWRWSDLERKENRK
jgi:hypothetical protein